MNKFSIIEAKDLLRIPQLWRHFGYHGEPGTSCQSPFRDDHKPSFSVSVDGKLWNDFATGDAGDAVDFFQRATGLSQKDSCRKFIEMAFGRTLPEPRTGQPRASGVKTPDAKPKPVFPDFTKGTADEINRLARIRSISREGLEWATERGILWFATLHVHRAWIITDAARVNAQARRLDGMPWEHVQAKAWTLPGSWAAWPIGVREANQFPTIALCEGGPDLLAVHDLALWEGASHYANRDAQCAPVAMLGATLNIHPDALPMFESKRVRIFSHADDAGRAAAIRWKDQLKTVGAVVDAVRFDGLRRADGKPVKDLNDALLMDAASRNQAWRLLP